MKRRRKPGRFDHWANRIRVDSENSVVRVLIGGLSEEKSLEIVKKAIPEANRLLDERASLRRFRPPYTIRFLDENERAILTLAESKAICDELTLTESGISQIVAEDSRGRKASVRIEVLNLPPA